MVTKQEIEKIQSNENSAFKHFLPLLHLDVPRPLTDSPDHFLHSTSPASTAKSSDTYITASVSFSQCNSTHWIDWK